jgi:hypothetical protein
VPLLLLLQASCASSTAAAAALLCVVCMFTDLSWFVEQARLLLMSTICKLVNACFMSWFSQADLQRCPLAVFTPSEACGFLAACCLPDCCCSISWPARAARHARAVRAAAAGKLRGAATCKVLLAASWALETQAAGHFE